MINISVYIRKLPPATGGGAILEWTLVNSNLKSSLRGGGVFWSELWSTQIWSLQLVGGGGYSGTKFQNRGVLENLDKNLLFEVNCTETCLCITESLSHTTYVETNQNQYVDQCKVTKNILRSPAPPPPTFCKQSQNHVQLTWCIIWCDTTLILFSEPAVP